MATHYYDTHYYDPNPLYGNSRKGSDANQDVKNFVKSEIIRQGQEAGLSRADIQNLLAIAEHESGFNPDAANKDSSASGVFQITDGTAQDATQRLDGSKLIGGYDITLPYDRFDPISNIETGIAVYLDKKRRAGSDDIEKIYKKYNPSATDSELTELSKRSKDFASEIPGDGNNTPPLPLVCTPEDANGDGIPDYMEDIKKKVAKASVTRSPIALDLNGDGITTTTLQDGASFDHDANGFAEQTGWVNNKDGLLVRDLDGNGTIDTGRELFGTETLLANGQKAANGYEALAELDSNHDGQINQQDASFSSIKIWKDLDGDGHSNSDELLTLSEAGIQSIATGYATTSQTDVNGNIVKQTGAFTKTDGSTGVSADIWFQVDKANTIANDWLEETDAIAALPDLEGFGNVYDLHQAMLRDGSGHLQALVEQFASETDATARHALATQIIYAWTGVEDIDPASRSARLIYGNAIGDARKLASLEALLGEPYLGTWCWGERDPNPHGPASKILLQAFNELADSIYSQLMAQTHFKPLLDTISYTWNTTTLQYDWDVSDAGNELDNILTGNAENNFLAGMAGSDTCSFDLDALLCNFRKAANDEAWKVAA